MRHTRSVLYEQVVGELRKGARNTHHIAQATGINYETVKKILGSLEAAQILSKDGRLYSLQETHSTNPDTIMGLPLDEERKTLLCQIARRIQELSPQPFNNTFLQKAVVAVIKKDQLNLPCGLYLFGQCTVLQTLPELSEHYESTTKHDATIKQVIKEFTQFPTTDDLMRSHYSASGNTLYLSRLKLDKLFKQPFTTDALDLIELELQDMLFSFTRTKENEDLYDYLSGFFVTFSRLKKTGLEGIESLRLEIYSAFKTLWELIGSYHFIIEAQSSYAFAIFPYYERRKDLLKELASNYITHLQTYLPPVRIDPAIEKLRGSRSS